MEDVFDFERLTVYQKALDFADKVYKGSSRECVAIAEIARRRAYITDMDKASLRNDVVELSKMLNGLSKSLDKEK